MKRTLLSLVVCVAIPAFAADEPWIAEARSVAGSVPPKLLLVLTAEINRSGPEGAIAVCRDEAPRLAQAASKDTGWTVRRVSLRNRNPKAVPDRWERAALEDFDRRAAAGETPATLERAEIVQEDGRPVYRYVRALPTAALCLGCHGAPGQLSPAVTGQLKSLYPDDLAVGYVAGQVRGAMTIRKPQ